MPPPETDLEFFANLRSLADEAGEEQVADLATSFVQHTGQSIASLRQAVLSKDLTTAKALIHDLKGSCATFGAMTLAKASRELEANVGQASVAEATSLVEGLERSFVDLERALERFKAH